MALYDTLPVYKDVYTLILLVYEVRKELKPQFRVGGPWAGYEAGCHASFPFRAKRIPDPVPSLSLKMGKEFSPAELRQQGGLVLSLLNFDFETKCTTDSYTVTRVAADGSRQIANNEGSRFSEGAKALIEQAQSGDIFIFSNIQCTCQGETENRRLNNIAYFVR